MNSKSQLEQDYDSQHVAAGWPAEKLHKLIRLLQAERDAAQENFRVTNRAYVNMDKIATDAVKLLKANVIYG